MTALYVPEGIPPPALIGALAERGIVIAGGLHKDIKVRSRAPRGCEESGKTVLTIFNTCCCFALADEVHSVCCSTLSLSLFSIERKHPLTSS